MSRSSGLKPLTVLVPLHNVHLVQEAARLDGSEKISVYLRRLVNKDLQARGLIPPDGDIILQDVEWDGQPVKKRRA
jgi:hypothetical protein